jgi:hypothetical protein
VLRSGEGEGRVPSLMSAAVEKEFSKAYFFYFAFNVQFMGRSG